MGGLGVDKQIPVSITKLTPRLSVGFISSNFTVDKLIPISPRAITSPPKISLLLKVKSIDLKGTVSVANVKNQIFFKVSYSSYI